MNSDSIKPNNLENLSTDSSDSTTKENWKQKSLPKMIIDETNYYKEKVITATQETNNLNNSIGGIKLGW